MNSRRVPSRLAFAFAAALTAFALLAGCTGTAPSPSPTASTSGESWAVASSTHTLVVAGQTRTYRIYRPASVSPSSAAPLVVMLHGALGTASQAESSYGWDQEADRHHFIVAYPDGERFTWDVSSGCCGGAAADHVDDVGFISHMVNTISHAMRIDPNRIYATGISNGGALDYRLACDTTIFAAIGPDSTNMLNDCPSPEPLSVIHIHGTADQTFPYDGGPGKRDNGGTGNKPADTSGPPIPELNAQWRGIDRCASPADSIAGDITTSVAPCPGGRAVELVTITGAGHQWPGQPGPTGAIAKILDPPYPNYNATAAIWTFFAAHPKS